MDAETAYRAAYQAERRISRATDIPSLQRVVLEFCVALGGEAVSADDPRAMPIDMTIDQPEPQLIASDSAASREWLMRLVPEVVLDARIAAARFEGAARLVNRASTDSLTGLWNRRAADLVIDGARAGDCVAMLDLDHFKNVNDTQGHAAGDVVLVEFGRHLRASLREPAVVARMGGEEFLVVLPATDLDSARQALERVRTSWPQVASIPITFSAGVAEVSADTAMQPGGAGTTLVVADELLYKAKQAGRDRILG